MEVNLPIKVKDKIYNIHNHQVEAWYIEKITVLKDADPKFLSYDIMLDLERYKDGNNSSKTQQLLKHCFLTEEELMNNLGFTNKTP